MTNISSGSNKRALEGDNGYDADSRTKRPREREREDPRDWREVHLRSPREAGKPSGEGGSRREDGRGDRRDSARREIDHRRPADYGRSRDRRDDRDRDRDYRPRRDGSGKISPPTRDHLSPAISNGHSKDDSEKEEGE
jgi:serine/threonine-protein kinase PRP4